MNLQSLPKNSQLLAVVANVIFLSYLIVFATAQPSPALVAAVTFELAFFASLLAYRRWRSSTVCARQADQALLSLEEDIRALYIARRVMAALSISFLSAVCLYSSIDLSALLLSRCGQSPWAKPIYLAIAPPTALGSHPAFSLELLAGAYIDSGKLSQAEPLLLDLLDIRQRVAGARSELTAAMYANLGDYYRKCGRNAEAESFYLRSIALSKELRIPQGYGSPMTKLGSLLRDEGQFARSQECFTEALAVRTRIFGNNSIKVAETMLENATLLAAEKHPEQARRMRQLADRINRSSPAAAAAKALDLAPLVVLALSLLFISQRHRLLAFAADWSSKRRSTSAGSA